MAGNPRRQAQTKDFKDPFNAGQMMGMLMMLTFIEQNNGIPPKALEKIKWQTAANLEIYLEKPAEDIFLMINSIIKDIGLL